MCAEKTNPPAFLGYLRFANFEDDSHASAERGQGTVLEAFDSDSLLFHLE